MIQSFLDRARGITWSDAARVGRWFLMVNGVFALAAFAYLHQPYRLTYNNTWSMPKGFWYYNSMPQTAYERGRAVMLDFQPPAWLQQRSWHDAKHNTLIKSVAAVPGDHLSVKNGVVRNCGATPARPCRTIGTRLAWDSSFNKLYFNPLPEVVPARHYYLKGHNPRSMDSRYMGLFSVDAIRGRAFELFTAAIPESARQLADGQVTVPHMPVTQSRQARIPGQTTPVPDHWRAYDENGTPVGPEAPDAPRADG